MRSRGRPRATTDQPGGTDTPRTATVMVPTWKREECLRRALEGLARQTRPADEVLVVVRAEDEPARAVVAATQGLPVREVLVQRPGLVAARNAALAVATGDVVVYLDDDAVPAPDWLERILRHYEADPRVGAVGGRDQIFHGDRPQIGESRTVGRITWYGRFVGFHHLGVGGAREVDVLKGANMSFDRARLPDLRADTNLRGRGAEHLEDYALTLAVKSRGLVAVYDPAIRVDHYEAARFDEPRIGAAGWALLDRIHNQTYMAVRYLPAHRAVAHVLYTVLVGTTIAPGVALAASELVRSRRVVPVLRAFVTTLRGRGKGIATGLAARSAARAAA